MLVLTSAGPHIIGCPCFKTLQFVYSQFLTIYTGLAPGPSPSFRLHIPSFCYLLLGLKYISFTELGKIQWSNWIGVMITFYLLNWSKENCNFETQWNSMIENIGTHRTYCSLFGMLGSSFYSTVKYEKRLSNGYKFSLNGFAKLVSLSFSINSSWMNTEEKHDITKHKNSRCEYMQHSYTNCTS